MDQLVLSLSNTELMWVIKTVIYLWGFCAFHLFNFIFYYAYFKHILKCAANTESNACIPTTSSIQLYMVSRLLPFCSGHFCSCELFFLNLFLFPLFPEGTTLVYQLFITPKSFNTSYIYICLYLWARPSVLWSPHKWCLCMGLCRLFYFAYRSLSVQNSVPDAPNTSQGA
jgi:hypothetical protein